MITGPVLVLLSGGRDSVCLLHMAVERAGAVRALHVNYGLRPEADGDEAFCRALCESLGVELHVLRAGEPVGNVQAWARSVRYAEARRLADGALIAVGHTATDQVETVLYRLATSPGRRALLGMAPRSGDVIRPLLGMTREQTAAYCVEHGLAWREDATNAASARGLIRERVLPALRELHPAAEENVLRTVAALRDEAAVLDAAVDAALEVARGGDAGAAGGGAGAGVDLRGLPRALARLVLQRLADESGGGRAPALGAHADAVLALSPHGTAGLDLPGGLRAVSEYGRVRIVADDGPPPAPVRLDVPGRAAYGTGEIVAERGAFPIADGTLAAAALAPTLDVRPWRPGDRMRPLGLDGSASLQDLFTNRKVPRARRAQLPVVVSGGEIAWVPGVATGERFRVHDTTTDRVRLTWRLDSAAP